MNGRMFALQWVADQPWFVQLFFYFVLMMFLFLAGFWGATVYKRWEAAGTLGMDISPAVVAVASLALITWQGGWGSARTPPAAVVRWAPMAVALKGACGLYCN